MITEREVLAIGRVVADFCGVTEADFMGRRKQVERCDARDLAVWVAKQFKASLPTIGRAFGGRCHTTILNGYRNASHLWNTDPEWQCKASEAFALVTCDGGPLAAEEALAARRIHEAHAYLDAVRAARDQTPGGRAKRARASEAITVAGYTRKQLERMNTNFCAAMRTAGYVERRP